MGNVLGAQQARGCHATAVLEGTLNPAQAEDRFLEALEVRAAQVCAELTGQPAGPLNETLVAGLRELSAAYNRLDGDLHHAPTTPASLSARLQFFLPRDAPKSWLPLTELWNPLGLSKRSSFRILDLGAGTGATSLGASGFIAARNPAAQIAIDAVDSFAGGLSAFERLASHPEALHLPDLSLHTTTGDLHKWLRREAGSGPRYDLILLGLVLNEGGAGDDAADLVLRSLKRALTLLNPTGALIIVEPALRLVSRRLQQLRDQLEAAEWCTIFAPCPMIDACPLLESPDDWCHQVMHRKLPPHAARLADAANLRSKRLTFSYLTLVCPDQPRLGELHKGARRDTIPLRVVSDPLPSKGKLELVLCGPEGRRIGMRLDRHSTPQNRPFENAQRGDFLAFSVGENFPDGSGLRIRIGKERTVKQLGDPQPDDSD